MRPLLPPKPVRFANKEDIHAFMGAFLQKYPALDTDEKKIQTLVKELVLTGDGNVYLEEALEAFNQAYFVRIDRANKTLAEWLVKIHQTNTLDFEIPDCAILYDTLLLPVKLPLTQELYELSAAIEIAENRKRHPMTNAPISTEDTVANRALQDVFWIKRLHDLSLLSNEQQVTELNELSASLADKKAEFTNKLLEVENEIAKLGVILARDQEIIPALRGIDDAVEAKKIIDELIDKVNSDLRKERIRSSIMTGCTLAVMVILFAITITTSIAIFPILGVVSTVAIALGSIGVTLTGLIATMFVGIGMFVKVDDNNKKLNELMTARKYDLFKVKQRLDAGKSPKLQEQKLTYKMAEMRYGELHALVENQKTLLSEQAPALALPRERPVESPIAIVSHGLFGGISRLRNNSDVGAEQEIMISNSPRRYSF